jgi:hypothetical protein
MPTTIRATKSMAVSLITGPGKANAQTLCGAFRLQLLACAYDLFQAELTSAEKRQIETGRFIPGAEFLRDHRISQLHNHEVMINGALGIRGVLLGRGGLDQFGYECSIRFALSIGKRRPSLKKVILPKLPLKRIGLNRRPFWVRYSPNPKVTADIVVVLI